MWYWAFKYIFLGPILRVLGRPTIEGHENIPTDGPAILASNHLAVMDSFFLPLMVDRRIYFLAKSEYFTGTGLKAGSSPPSVRSPSTGPAPRRRRAHSPPRAASSTRAS
jgi:hypothetical protein